MTNRALVLFLLAGLAACGPEIGTKLDDGAPVPPARDLAAKYFPSLTQTPVFTPAAPSLEESLTVTFAPSGGDIGNLLTMRSFDNAGDSQITLTAKGDGKYGVMPGLESQITPQKYTVGLVQVKSPQVNEGYSPLSIYEFDPAKSKTHFVLKVSCYSEGNQGDMDKCIPEYVDFDEGKANADAWKAMAEELTLGFVSDIALPFVTVGPSAVDFAVEVTQVTRVDANNVDVFYTLTNAGAADAIVRYAVWAHSSAAPTVNGTANNYIDQPILGGETLHLQWRAAFTSTSGNSYTAYVLADQDGKFVEGNETDNLGSKAWSVP